MLSVISITMVEYYWVGTKGEGKWANCKPPLEFGFGHVTKYTNVLHWVLLIPVKGGSSNPHLLPMFQPLR